MSFSFRLFAGFLIVAGVAGYLFFNTAMTQLELAIAQSAEETMVDTANLLAELIEDDLAMGRYDRLNDAFEGYRSREISARIFEVVKETPSFRVYVTDDHGIVRFDSAHQAVGQDYSRWNDVLLTLRGEYGARTTRVDPDDEDTAVLYVAAPIQVDGEIAGVISVGKSRLSLTAYREQIRDGLVAGGALMLSLSLVMAFVLSWWFSRSIGRLRRYADVVSADIAGESAITIPDMSEPEFDALANAMARMRATLQGKAYIEDYVRGLMHELKSPISAIRGALELLDGAISDDEKARFLDNITHESDRLWQITTRLLELAELEYRPELSDPLPCELLQLARSAVTELDAQAGQKAVSVELTGTEAWVQGDRFLLNQAIRNLIDNAIRWSPVNGRIVVSVGPGRLVVSDEGPGIPDFALDRLCDRFYALPDPVTGKKSTGLGLSFVRQIMLLHGGGIGFENRDKGLSVTLEFSTTTQ